MFPEGHPETVNVAICTTLEEDFQRRIAALDPRIRVYDIAELSRNELRDAAQGKKPDRSALDRLLAEAAVMLMLRSPYQLLARAPKLRWIQLTSAGVDHAAGAGLLNSNLLITNARGMQAIPIAEYVVGAMLMFAKGMLRSLDQKRAGRWERYVATELREKTVAVIGLGNIGSEVARLAGAFGMRVIATRKSATRREPAAGIDLVYPAADLPEMLGRADYVVLSLPLTGETTALITALKQGTIAGAGLDVFSGEPLPESSELWKLPNVILTPHIAGGSELYNARMTDLFCDNLQRYLAGSTLRNLVDKGKAY